MKLIDFDDSYDVLRDIDFRPGLKDIILDFSSNSALQLILTQVRSIRLCYIIVYRVRQKSTTLSSFQRWAGFSKNLQTILRRS